MATVTIAHHPELTVDRALGVFMSHFHGKYDVYESSAFGRLRRIVVKKNAMTAVAVNLKQEPETTTFVFGAFIPSGLMRGLFGLIGVLIALLFLRPTWKAMEAEVRVFIENAADFR